MEDKKWIPFWFEANLAWGLIDSKEEWQRIKKEYTHRELRDAKRADHRYETDGTPYFGFRMECCLPETLGEWADRNGMDIS